MSEDKAEENFLKLLSLVADDNYGRPYKQSTLDPNLNYVAPKLKCRETGGVIQISGGKLRNLVPQLVASFVALDFSIPCLQRNVALVLSTQAVRQMLLVGAFNQVIYPPIQAVDTDVDKTTSGRQTPHFLFCLADPLVAYVLCS